MNISENTKTYIKDTTFFITASPATGMEAMLRERKNKQLAAKKAQTAQMSKGKNMFKQMQADSK